MIAIHADFAFDTSWHFDSVSRIRHVLQHDHFLVLSSEHLEFPLPMPIVFSFYLPCHARRVCMTSSHASPPQHLPQAQTTGLSKSGFLSYQCDKAQFICLLTSRLQNLWALRSPTPRRTRPCFQTTPRKSVRPTGSTKDARQYIRLFVQGESLRPVVPVPISRGGGSQ